jgi:hypothetical protein
MCRRTRARRGCQADSVARPGGSPLSGSRTQGGAGDGLEKAPNVLWKADLASRATKGLHGTRLAKVVYHGARRWLCRIRRGGPVRLTTLLAVVLGQAGWRKISSPRTNEPPSPSSRAQTSWSNSLRTASTPFLRRMAAQEFRAIGPRGNPRCQPRARPHPRRRPQRLRQGQLNRGARAPAYRRRLRLVPELESLARQLEESPPPPKSALAAKFVSEGEKGACTLACEWADGAKLADASTCTLVYGQPRTEVLGWDAPCVHSQFVWACIGTGVLVPASCTYAWTPLRSLNVKARQDLRSPPRAKRIDWGLTTVQATTAHTTQGGQFNGGTKWAPQQAADNSSLL